jgi:hypothetical protein
MLFITSIKYNIRIQKNKRFLLSINELSNLNGQYFDDNSKMIVYACFIKSIIYNNWKKYMISLFRSSDFISKESKRFLVLRKESGKNDYAIRI